MRFNAPLLNVRMCIFCAQLALKQAQALKQTILNEAAGTSNGLKASQQQRDAISKAVNGLVALNPTKDITTSELATGKSSTCFPARIWHFLGLASQACIGVLIHRQAPLLRLTFGSKSSHGSMRQTCPARRMFFQPTGTWNLVYTTTAGASGGKLGPFVGEVQQEVDIADGLYVNYVRVGPLTGELEATWEVVNKTQWKVTARLVCGFYRAIFGRDGYRVLAIRLSLHHCTR